MKAIVKLVLMTGLFLGQFQTFGQHSEIWDFDRCIKLAPGHSLEMQFASYQNELARLELTNAKTAFLPNTEGSTSLNMNLGRSIDPITNEITQAPVYYSSAGANTSITLFDGFRNWSELRKSELNLKNSVDLERQRRRDLYINVANVYIDIMFKEEALEMLKKELQAPALQLKRMEVLVDAGRQPRSNAYDLKPKILQDQSNVLIAENNLDQRVLSLKNILQIKFDEAFELAEFMLSKVD